MSIEEQNPCQLKSQKEIYKDPPNPWHQHGKITYKKDPPNLSVKR